MEERQVPLDLPPHMSFMIPVGCSAAAFAGVAFLLAASSERVSLCTTLDSKLVSVGYSLEK